jgi:UDP-GlcNAc:undecaprenyl-phosphate/decaprenyl-phosphate GlcNAc-1-phosphate transferase
MVGAIVGLGVLSFLISWVGTWGMKHLALRIGFVDKPGYRKIHAKPKPLGGGVAVFWGLTLPMLAVLAYAWWGSVPAEYEAYAGGVRMQTRAAVGIMGGMLALHLMGLLDDKRALGPYSKLVVQLGVATALVTGFEIRALMALGYWPSVVLTTLWIVAITNAFNFLDNMDGLSAGIAAVCATAFLIATVLIGQWFVAGMLALLLGALVGFLCFNFPPASIFMGDSGSLTVGFVLGVLTVRTTFLPKGEDWGAGWYAVVAPVIVLALPLYDLVVVSLIRLSKGKSPFQGDTNHFSHRLVRRGMSKRTAVLCLWLVAGCTSVAAIVLPHVRSGLAAAMIFLQTLLILGLVLLLEQHPLPVPEDETVTPAPPAPSGGTHGA